MWSPVSAGLAEAVQNGGVSITGDATMAQEFFERFPNVAARGPDVPMQPRAGLAMPS